MFDCGINIVYGEMNTTIEDGIIKAVHNVGIDIDKEKLFKAITNARKFYDDGVLDGKMQALNEIVRCEGCVFKKCLFEDGDVMCNFDLKIHKSDWYCPKGKRSLSDDD